MQSLSAFKSAGGMVFLFSWERLGGGLLETIVFSKAVPEVLNMKYRSEFKGKKSPQGNRYAVVPSKCLK